MPKTSKSKLMSKRRENKCFVTFNDEDRQDFLTGFHKRKVERRKAAVAEIRKKIKEEQNRVREERRKEYSKMLKERTEALEEIEDDLEDWITNTTESVQYDHPNHTVTVTTISDLDITGPRLPSQDVPVEEKEDTEKSCRSMPKKAGNPILNKRIRSLTTSLNSCRTKKKQKGKHEGRGGNRRGTDKRSGAPESNSRTKRTTKKQRRQHSGKKVHRHD